jgi:hypothetical protein
VYFMAVVVLTMFAAQSFDSRLIWDAATMGKTPPKRCAPPPLGAPRFGTALRRRGRDAA